MLTIVESLFESHDPYIRYRCAVDVCGLDPDSPSAAHFGRSTAAGLRNEIGTSEKIRRILSVRDEAGRFPSVYGKYTGAHWTLADLADNGYPIAGGSMVDWGVVSREKVMNEFVSVEALSVLKASGRLHKEARDAMRLKTR